MGAGRADKRPRRAVVGPVFLAANGVAPRTTLRGMMNLTAVNAIAPTATPADAGRSESTVVAPPVAADRDRPARLDYATPPTPAPTKKSSKPRDHRLDFWRGLCLVDMVVVHLIFAGISFGPWASPLLGEYAR